MSKKKQTKTKPTQNKLYLKIMLNIKAKLELLWLLWSSKFIQLFYIMRCFVFVLPANHFSSIG